MAVTISKLNVLLTAGATSFKSVIGDASASLAKFGRDATATAAGFVIGDVIRGSAHAMVEWTKQAFESIDVAAKLSDRMGIATEAIAGLQYAADLSGVSNEELTKGLEKMLKTVGEAGQGTKTAVAAFEGLGISVKDLSGKRPDEVLAMVADKLNAIDDPAARAAAAMDIFGKAGQGMLPFLAEGSAGFAEMQAQAEKLGITFSRVDAAKVEAANDAITTAGYALQGVGQSIAVELSPYIQAAADYFTEMATSGEGIKGKVGSAVEFVASAIATVSDYLELAKGAFGILQIGGTAAMLGLVKGIDATGQGLVKLLNLLPGVQLEWTDTFANLTTGLEQELDDLQAKTAENFKNFQDGKNSKAVAKYFDEIKAKADAAAKAVEQAAPKGKITTQVEADTESAGKALEKLKQKLEQASMTDAQAKLAEVAGKGATAEQLKQAETILKQIDAVNKAKERQLKIDQDAKKLLEATRTPVEKYNQTQKELSDLLAAGAVTWETYQRAVNKAQADLFKAADATMKPQAAPELVVANSSASAEMIARMEARAAGEKQTTKAQEQLLKEAQDQNKTLGKISDRLAKAAELNIFNF